jgi:5-methylcytosine-specific restriction endonuclease McrA
LSRGGRNDWTNLAITCAVCNRSKGASTVEEFFDLWRANPTNFV